MMKLLKDNALLLALTLAVMVTGGSLMIVSQKVYEKQRHVQSLDQQILTGQWDIRALKAELAFLSRPDRLDQIATAVSQQDPSFDEAAGIEPISFIYNDLPAGMSVLPPAKPARASYQRATLTPAKAVTKTVIKQPEPVVKKSPRGFASLLDSLGEDE